MNVKLKKRMTKLFKDVAPGETFVHFERVYIKTLCASIRGDTCEAVDLDGTFSNFNADTEVEIIHGTFVEDGAE